MIRLHAFHMVWEFSARCAGKWIYFQPQLLGNGLAGIDSAFGNGFRRIFRVRIDDNLLRLFGNARRCIFPYKFTGDPRDHRFQCDNA